jgi:spore germination protein KB
VLGIEYTKNSEIPLFEVIKLINIGDIITNLDAIATLILFMGGFFKMTLHFYGGVLAVQSLFKIKNERWLLVVCAILFIWFSFTYYEHLVFHRWVGLEFSISYWYSPFSYFEIYCPILILFIIWLKIKRH